MTLAYDIPQAIDATEACWICGGNIELVKRSNIKSAVTPESFCITDAGYGVTYSIFKCVKCGFLECPDAGDPLSFYAGMADNEYEATRDARMRQAANLVGQITRFRKTGSWLDIGAGSGTVVEAARQKGFSAIGVEPSEWLAGQGRKRGLDIKTGVLPHPEITGTFDIVTMVDVIEHVTNPVGLLADMAASLKPGGIGCVITPDADSFFARMLGWKWWHYRIAHVGYFSLPTLDAALKRAGLEKKAVMRPSWRLPADYLMNRLAYYLPPKIRPEAPRFLSRFTIPLNLYDSLMVVVTRAE